LARFDQAARHLGRFNGAFLDGRPLPEYAWLNRRLLHTRADRNLAFWSNLEAVRALPLFRRGWPGDLAERALGLFHERHALLGLLERLPHTLRHADADRRNLLARDHGTRTETVAIDWAYTGIGPLGEEVAPLVVSSVLWFKGVAPADLNDLDATAFDAYVAGLRDAGWRGDPGRVRFGCAATMALRYGPLGGIVSLVTANAEQRSAVEQTLGHSLDEAFDRYAEMQRFLFERADEARRLSGIV
jgi:prepilin-type processing-associated H-X9-DG protein